MGDVISDAFWWFLICVLACFMCYLLCAYEDCLAQRNAEKKRKEETKYSKVVYDYKASSSGKQNEKFENNKSDVWYMWHEDIQVTNNNTVTKTKSKDLSSLTASSEPCYRSAYTKTLEQFCGFADTPSKVIWKVKINHYSKETMIKNNKNCKQYKKIESQDCIGIIMGTNSCEKEFNYPCVPMGIFDDLPRSTYLAGTDYYAIYMNGKKQSRKRLLNCKESISGARGDRNFNSGDIIEIEFDIEDESISIWKNNKFVGAQFRLFELPERKLRRCRLAINIGIPGNSYSLLTCTIVPNIRTNYDDTDINIKEFSQLQSVFNRDNINETLLSEMQRNNPWCDWSDCMSISKDFRTITTTSCDEMENPEPWMTKSAFTNSIKELVMNKHVHADDAPLLRSDPSRVVWILHVDQRNDKITKSNGINRIAIINGIVSCEAAHRSPASQEYGLDVENGTITHLSCERKKYHNECDFCDNSELCVDFKGFEKNDIIAVDFNIASKTLSFWKNDTFLGVAFKDIPVTPKNVGDYRLFLCLSKDFVGSCSLIDCKMTFGIKADKNTADKCATKLRGLTNAIEQSIRDCREIENILVIKHVTHEHTDHLSQLLAKLSEKKEKFDRVFQVAGDTLDKKLKNAQSRLHQGYRHWDIDQIMGWIKTLENGRFAQYCDVLEQNFITDKVLGKDLPHMTRNDLRDFGVSTFDDRLVLERYCQRLLREDAV